MTDDARPALRQAAIAAIRQGWHVFPLARSGKQPVIRGWESRATTDPEHIGSAWSRASYNVGIATGPSGLVVVDLDVPKSGDGKHGASAFASLAARHGRAVPEDTYTVATPSGGLHLYFVAPPGGSLRNTAGKLGPLVDTRAQGGYVVGAGSVIDGVPYNVVRDTVPAPFPAWLADLLSERPTPPAVRRSSNGRVPGARAVGLVRTVLTAPEGQRNSRLYWAALRAYEGCGSDAEQVVAALMDAALAVGLAEREAHATVNSAARRCGGHA